MSSAPKCDGSCCLIHRRKSRDSSIRKALMVMLSDETCTSIDNGNRIEIPPPWQSKKNLMNFSTKNSLQLKQDASIVQDNWMRAANSIYHRNIHFGKQIFGCFVVWAGLLGNEIFFGDSKLFALERATWRKSSHEKQIFNGISGDEATIYFSGGERNDMDGMSSRHISRKSHRN